MSRSVAALTFRNEMWRSVPSGVLDAAYNTFVMILAVKVFDASEAAKSVLLSSPRLGHIAAILVVPLLMRFRSTVAQTAAVTQIIGSVCFGLSAAFPKSE